MPTYHKKTASQVKEHIEAYRQGWRDCPRTVNRVGPTVAHYTAAYIAEWDRQCLELRKAMFIKGVAK